MSVCLEMICFFIFHAVVLSHVLSFCLEMKLREVARDLVVPVGGEPFPFSALVRPAILFSLFGAIPGI